MAIKVTGGTKETTFSKADLFIIQSALTDSIHDSSDLKYIKTLRAIKAKIVWIEDTMHCLSEAKLKVKG